MNSIILIYLFVIYLILINSLNFDKLIVKPSLKLNNVSKFDIIIEIALNISFIITLKPFNVSFNKNVRVLNNECLFSGDIIIDSIPRGKAMISVCNNSQHIVSCILKIN
jgi:hypothetical protein